MDTHKNVTSNINETSNGRIILAKGKLATIHYDSAPRPQRSYFAHPNVHSKTKKRAKVILLFNSAHSQKELLHEFLKDYLKRQHKRSHHNMQ